MLAEFPDDGATVRGRVEGAVLRCMIATAQDRATARRRRAGRAGGGRLHARRRPGLRGVATGSGSRFSQAAKSPEERAAEVEALAEQLNDAVAEQNAASIAALFLTTAVVIVDKPERNSAGDPSGGMGGMDF